MFEQFMHTEAASVSTPLKKRFQNQAVLFFAAFFLLIVKSPAAIVFSNYGPLPDRVNLGNWWQPGGSVFSSVERVDAVGFTPSETVTFDAAELAVMNFNDPAQYTKISIYSDLGGKPGTSLESFTPSLPFSLSGSGTPGLIVLSGSRPVLQAGTQYWLVLNMDSRDYFAGIRWYHNNTGDTSSTASPFATSFSYTPTSETDWDLQNLGQTRPAFAIYGTPIPEPATASIMLLGLMAPLVWRRRP
jgi:hypothetical protein